MTYGKHPRVTYQPQCEKCGSFDTVTVKSIPMPDEKFIDEDGRAMVRKQQMRYRRCRCCAHITKAPHVQKTIPDTKPRRVTGGWAK